jgi:hypothetical protein
VYAQACTPGSTNMSHRQLQPSVDFPDIECLLSPQQFICMSHRLNVVSLSHRQSVCFPDSQSSLFHRNPAPLLESRYKPPQGRLRVRAITHPGIQRRCWHPEISPRRSDRGYAQARTQYSSAVAGIPPPAPTKSDRGSAQARTQGPSAVAGIQMQAPAGATEDTRERASTHLVFQRCCWTPDTNSTQERQLVRAITHPGIQRRYWHPATSPRRDDREYAQNTHPEI